MTGCRAGLGLLLWALLACMPAQAHLMVAQQGTLNLVGDGAFAVVSIPVQALHGVDDDGDGRLSAEELRQHAAAIEQQVQDGFQLRGPDGRRALQALMLTLSPDDAQPTAPASQVVALGRFALAPQDRAEPSLLLRFSLFGQDDAARQHRFTITRGQERQLLVLTPEHPERALLASAWAELMDAAALGVQHIVTGLDHLVFLLLVLAAGWGKRSVLLSLTAFTVGHAVTLTWCVWGGLVVPPRLVEPAIAATVLLMAALEWHLRRRGQRLPESWRMALVFGCALIHGLGLGNALLELGLDTRHRMVSLAGFNLGIEAAQLAVAGAVAGALALWRTSVRGRALQAEALQLRGR